MKTDTPKPTAVSFKISVFFDAEEDVYIAECEQLCLVTEAPTYEELVQRAEAVVPDLIELNLPNLLSAKVTLEFAEVQELQSDKWSPSALTSATIFAVNRGEFVREGVDSV